MSLILRESVYILSIYPIYFLNVSVTVPLRRPFSRAPVTAPAVGTWNLAAAR
jgi:hypothetical protein